MSELEQLLASYLDLQEQHIELDPSDPVWLQARLAALRSIVHATEDLDLHEIADEVDRTMLIDTIRLDIQAITSIVKPAAAEAIAESRLTALTFEPVGIRGTLRILELRRAGIERGLQTTASLLGFDAPLAAVATIRDESLSELTDSETRWQEEWRNCGEFLVEHGLQPASEEAPPLREESTDEWTMGVLALRGHAVLMLDAARSAQPRAVRQRLVAPGLLAGWGRTAAALVKETSLFAQPERRLMLSYQALLENLAAEADLQIQAQLQTPDEATVWVQERLGDRSESSEVVHRAVRLPYGALAAALSHEGWQTWYGDVGGDGAAFLKGALQWGGLSVRLARWAATAP